MVVGIIIQARMGSTRLPKKSLKLLRGKPIVHRCYEQCSKAKCAEKVIVAIPEGELDDPLFEYCKENNMDVFRGDHDNLIKRYHDCAKANDVDTVIRITGDNPIVDPDIIDLVYAEHVKQNGDYTSTRHWDNDERKLSGLYPAGMSVDIFNIDTLEDMMEDMDNLNELEIENIVFYYCYRHRYIKKFHI